jgi:dipeptidyl aminopeptidase/acylaminoacyl peptidase
VVLRPRRGEAHPRPLCVWLHGGPNEFCALSYQPWWQLFVARGFTVLAPNYRGSGAYATERVRANVGDLGGGDASDVAAAVEAVARHPELGRHVERDRVVLFGWSYGAHLAFHVALRLGRAVRRIVAGGGVYDWLSHYGENQLRFPWRDYLGGSPLADARAADARSPVRRARALAEALGPRCEVLLVHGQNDGRASPVQSRLMYRALVEAGLAAKLVLYPREAHVFAEPDHVRDLLDRATRPLTDERA